MNPADPKRASAPAILVALLFASVLASTSFFQSAHAKDPSLAQVVSLEQEMIVTANPLATEAGARILRRGGNATDAMIAAQAVLGLVEPQSSGIGGGAFVVYYDAATKRTITYDAREAAPLSALEDRFANLKFIEAWQSGLSVGVPGVPKLLEAIHRKHGRTPWWRLFQPAIRLARNGFAITERTSNLVTLLLSRNPSCENRLFFRDPSAFEYFANPDCSAKAAGRVVRNPDYAHTLSALAWHGSKVFYQGPIAKAVVNAVRTDPHLAGDLSLNDLANYQVKIRPPVCFDYRSFNVCGMGPPSSGGLAVGQILGILENFDLSTSAALDPELVHLFTQAGRLAFADRNRYVADPDFVRVPSRGMLNKDYLAQRAGLITDRDLGRVSAGTPPGAVTAFAPHARAKPSGTSHVSIIDRYGNALSMTTTIESVFGNGVMVRGFLLNNELTDFSFKSKDKQGRPIVNRVEAGKRPRSSMSPTIVFDSNEQVKLVTGSPGGSRIISYTAQSIVNVLDLGLDPQQAVNVPHFMNRNGSTTDIEPPVAGATRSYGIEQLTDNLQARGHKVRTVKQTSGLSVIEQQKSRSNGSGRLLGGADKRRDGTVGGR